MFSPFGTNKASLLVASDDRSVHNHVQYIIRAISLRVHNGQPILLGMFFIPSMIFGSHVFGKLAVKKHAVHNQTVHYHVGHIGKP